MKTVIVLDTRPAQRLTACSERTQKGRRDRGPNTQSLCADLTQWHLTMRNMNRDYVPHGNKA